MKLLRRTRRWSPRDPTMHGRVWHMARRQAALACSEFDKLGDKGLGYRDLGYQRRAGVCTRETWMRRSKIT